MDYACSKLVYNLIFFYCYYSNTLKYTKCLKYIKNTVSYEYFYKTDSVAK